MIKQYADKLSGAYIGAYIGEHTPPDNGVVVPMAPEDARQVWDFDTNAWGPVPAVVPESIPALNGLLAIDAAGLSGAYQAWAASAERTFAERAFIDKAANWKRWDATILAGATALGLTDVQVDALFIAAAAIDE